MKATQLTPGERTKLVHILARLASDYDGERAAAGLLASRLLDAKGLTWDALIVGGLLYPQSPFPPHSPQQSWQGWLGEAHLCLSRPEVLTSWEYSFVVGLRDRRKLPTPRQLEVLAGIVAKIRAGPAGDPT